MKAEYEARRSERDSKTNVPDLEKLYADFLEKTRQV